MAVITTVIELNGMIDGKDGAPAESRLIRPSAQVVAVDANNVQAVPVTFKAIHMVGADEAPFTAYFLFTLMAGEVEAGRADGGHGTEASFTLPPNMFGNADTLVAGAYEDNGFTKRMCPDVRVTLSRANPQPFPRWEGWDVSLTYKNGEYLLYDNMVYMWRYPIAGNSTLNPKDDMAKNPLTTRWVAYQNYPLLATQVLLAQYALLGGAVAWEKVTLQDGKPVTEFAKMFSQTGTDGTTNYEKFDPTKDAWDASQPWKPNLCIDWKTGGLSALGAHVKDGTIDNCTVTDVKGMTGTFRKLTCVDDYGNTVGTITFSGGGRIWFDSCDLYHQGGKDGRNLRFYASDMLVRGGLGYLTLNTLKVNTATNVKYATVYMGGSSRGNIYLTEYRNASGMTEGGGDGHKWYTIPLYGWDDLSGVPFNVVIFTGTNDSAARDFVLMGTGRSEDMATRTAPIGSVVYLHNHQEGKSVFIHAGGNQYYEIPAWNTAIAIKVDATERGWVVRRLTMEGQTN